MKNRFHAILMRVEKIGPSHDIGFETEISISRLCPGTYKNSVYMLETIYMYNIEIFLQVKNRNASYIHTVSQ